MEYRPRQPVKLPSLDATAPLPLPERMRKLFAGTDRVAEFLQATLPASLRYTAEIAPEIAHSIDDIDRAMQWGYGWPLGPFELADAIGLERQALSHLATRAGRAPSSRSCAARAIENTVVASNAGASLIDLGDGVLAVSLHSKMNAIGGDALEMLQRGVREASDNFSALVVTAEGPNFSVGANLMLLLLEAQEGNWEEIDAMIRSFQKSTTGLRYSEVPVVVAPFGLTLGGGCEIVLHGDRVQAAAESYIGLVEVGVGLIPAGGGTKEMLLRLGAEKAFETIGFAKTSTSAPDARRLGYLRDVDGWTMNRDRLVFDAKQRGAEARAGRISAAAAAVADSRRRRRRFERRSISACISRGAQGASPITTRSSAASCHGSWPAAPCLTPGQSAKISCWISSVRRF